MCEDKAVLLMLHSMFSSNDSLWMDAIGEDEEPCNINATESTNTEDLAVGSITNRTVPGEIGKQVYAFVTPFIITLGILGNVTSLYIYSTKPMKKVSASLFLSAICISDCLVLMTYVLLDWLHKGLIYWPGGRSVSILGMDGICQCFIISAYMFRFTSAWLILVFTIERSIAVCKPLHKRVLCTRSTSRYSIISVFLGGAALGVIKAGMSSVQDLNQFGKVCAKRPSLENANFIFDLVYAALITVVPYLVITICNCLILKELAFKKLRIKTDDTRVKLSQRLKVELTLTLLAISSSFMLLSLPYFSLWLHQTIMTGILSSENPEEHSAHVHQMKVIRDWLYICRTAFYVNYSINILLYYISGSQYRKRICEILAYATLRVHAAFAGGSRQRFERPSTSASTTGCS